MRWRIRLQGGRGDGKSDLAPDHVAFFDPDRSTLRHLGFGRGAHYCLGAPLARLEATAALSAVTARFPRAQLASEPLYKANITLRGLSALTVAV